MTVDDLARLHGQSVGLARAWSGQEFSDLLERPETFVIPWEDRAFALGRAMGGEAELLTLVTHPGSRQQGLGLACLLGFEAEARARFATSAFLEVAEDNAAARALYAKTGYRGVGERPGYYKRATSALAALVLSKSLTSTR